jgi:hypothetical protein
MGGVNEKVKEGEYDEGLLHIYVNGTLKPVSHFKKREVKEGNNGRDEPNYMCIVCIYRKTTVNPLAQLLYINKNIKKKILGTLHFVKFRINLSISTITNFLSFCYC